LNFLELIETGQGEMKVGQIDYEDFFPFTAPHFTSTPTTPTLPEQIPVICAEPVTLSATEIIDLYVKVVAGFSEYYLCFLLV